VSSVALVGDDVGLVVALKRFYNSSGINHWLINTLCAIVSLNDDNDNDVLAKKLCSTLWYMTNFAYKCYSMTYG
jgi:hypothetical protein